mgnify:CR=1 FL=1
MKTLRHLMTALSLSALLFAGCDKYDDTAISGRVDELEGRVTQLETLAKQLQSNVSAMQLAVDALKSQDRIVSVEPLPDNAGFVVEFENAGKINVYNGTDGKDGADGKTPVIGVQKDEADGQYYWTIDGEPMLDNGKKIPATAQLGTPQIKIENDKFWFSVDEGKNWTECGDIRSAGIGTITNVTDNGDEVVFTLWDNSTITIPKVQAFAIEIGRAEVGVVAGQTTFIPYTIIAGDKDTKVKAMADEGYKVEVSGNYNGGELAVTAPATVTKASVFIVAISGKGEVAGKILDFEKGDLVLVKDGVTIDALGGEIELPFKTNMDAIVMIDPSANWIEQIPETKALQEYTYKFNVKAYENGTEPREGKIYITCDGIGRKEFTVRQLNTVKTGGGEADFNTFKTEVPATGQLMVLINDETEAGWKMTNGALRGHKQFTPIPEGGKAPWINGGTNAVGILESSMLTGGCDKLTIAYGVQSAGNIKTCGLKFLVEVTPKEGKPFSETVYSAGNSIVNKTAIQAILDVKISGSFSIKITNLCPKNTESVNNRGTYDSVIIQNVSWTGYTE